jgi:hypothetical protein
MEDKLTLATLRAFSRRASGETKLEVHTPSGVYEVEDLHLVHTVDEDKLVIITNKGE